jgi:hypothetical protein
MLTGKAVDGPAVINSLTSIISRMTVPSEDCQRKQNAFHALDQQ